MTFSKNEILTIIQEKFWDELYNGILDSILCLDSENLENAFENLIDYAELDEIYEIKLLHFEVEEDGDEYIVMGELTADVSLLGFVYWGGENIPMGTAEYEMLFAFQFEIENDEYFGFDIMYEC